MKNLNIVLGVLMLGFVLSGCMREDLQLDEFNSATPTLSGSLGDPHPALESVCQSLDTMFLWSEDGSIVINKCFGVNGPVTCAPDQKKWGYVILREGYESGISYMDCDFTMAPGWYGLSTNWKVGVASPNDFDSNGLPVVQGDWGLHPTDPCQNRWSLRFPTSTLPTGSFDLMVRVQAVRLNLSGGTNLGSETILWARNPYANLPSSPNFSATSSFVTHFTPQHCNDAPSVVENQCTSMLIGVPDLPSCTTLVANTQGISGNLSYRWSTGATSPSISVCPTSTEVYSVTVSSNGTPTKSETITVYVDDIHCGNGNNALHKVKVCHLPPGNPENMQEICIDWSGVPAHVASYRPAGSQQGHDSGCEIGRCGYNPCLQN